MTPSTLEVRRSDVRVTRVTTPTLDLEAWRKSHFRPIRSSRFSSLHFWRPEIFKRTDDTPKLTNYRATLCIARTMLSKYVCLSVCLYVTRRYSVETSKHNLKLFPPSGSHTILVFLYQRLWQHCNADLPNGGAECRGDETIAIFDQCLALSQKWYKIDP